MALSPLHVVVHRKLKRREKKKGLSDRHGNNGGAKSGLLTIRFNEIGDD
jgi:hypothetical protein